VASRRHMVASGATVVVHVALFAWASAVQQPALEPAPEAFEIELVEIGTVRDEPLAPEAGDEAEEEEPPMPEPSPVPRRVRSQPERNRAAERSPAEADVPALPVEAERPIARSEIAIEPTTSTDLPRSTAVATGTLGRDAPRSGGGTRGQLDHASYGAEIVRIVLAEIERDPVRGIGPTDTIQVLLDVLPNGELEWTRSGRYGFARIVRSSLGRIRTHQILRRIERASARFPVHPPGFARRRYVVDVTVNFKR
jgi:hypothetical protein